MAAKLELVRGDLLEGPSDLIVIPCSTVPTVSAFVSERLSAFRIPVPTEPMQLGEVRFLALDAAGQVAPMAAYATSVMAHTTRPEAIRAIGGSLGRFTAEHRWVQQIACPLLGAGAGHLRSETSVEEVLAGFRTEAPQDRDVVLRIFVRHEPVYERLKAHFAETTRTSPAAPPIRVFISYARTSDGHVAWVKELATFLRQNGIEARIDVWHLRPGMDVAQWMCNELDLADRVLLVCDELYSQKADRRHGGVGWEVRIVQGDLLATQGDNPDKYVPVVVTSDPHAGTPAFLKSVLAIHWPRDHPERDEARRDDLLGTLFRVSEEAPPLGSPPSFILNAKR